MKRLLFFGFLVSIVICSCYTVHNKMGGNLRYDREIAISNISFFGKLWIDSTKPKKRTYSYTAIFEKDNFSYLSVGDKKNIKKNKLFEIVYLSDSINIICDKAPGRYLSVDTLMFYQNDFFSKKTYYDIAGKILILSLFSHYKFSETQIVHSSKRCHAKNECSRTSIHDYSFGEISGEKVFKEDTSYVYQTFSSKEEAKNLFFTHSIR